MGYKYNFVINILKNEGIEGKTVLDIGCNIPQYKDFVNSKGGCYKGLDIEQIVDPQTNQFAVDIVASAECIPLRDNSVDIIFMVGVFYQISKPNLAIEEFKRVLKPSGRLYIFDYNRRTLRYLSEAEGIHRPIRTVYQLSSSIQKHGFIHVNPITCFVAINKCYSLRKFVVFVMEYIYKQWAIIEATNHK